MESEKWLKKLQNKSKMWFEVILTAFMPQCHVLITRMKNLCKMCILGTINIVSLIKLKLSTTLEA